MSIYVPGRDPELQKRIDEWDVLRKAEIARLVAARTDETAEQLEALLLEWERKNDFIKFVKGPRR